MVRIEAIKEVNKITQILETNFMTKNLQKMKIDGEKSRSDSCSSCNYVIKTEEIANKSDDSQSLQLSHNSAITTRQNSSQNSTIEIPSEYVKMVINKSDDSKGHNSATAAKVPTVKTKKITKPSTNKYSSDTPNRPSWSIKNAICSTPSVKKYFSSVEKDLDQNDSSINPAKKNRT